MTSLLALVAPRVGDAVLEPVLLELLDGVTSDVAQLSAAVQPFLGDRLAVHARGPGATGWEVGIALPAFAVRLPGAQAGAIDGRAVVRSVPGDVSVRSTAGRQERCPHLQPWSVSIEGIPSSPP